MQDVQARQEAKLNRGAGHRIGAGDDGLRSDDGGGGGKRHQLGQCPFRHHQEERVRNRLGVAQHQGALAQIVQQQRGEHEAIPRKADRFAAKVAKVGIQRLGPGDGKENGAKHGESDRTFLDQERHRIARIEGKQNVRVGDGLHDSGAAKDEEPDRSNRPEGGGDRRGAVALHKEQRNENTERQGQHEGSEGWRDQLQPLNRRKHGNCGRNCGVTEKERGTRDAKQQQRDRTAADGKPREGVKRQHTAFAMVVGAQKDGDVFDRHDDNNNPDQHRDDPHHL
ncbi:hypothetical protein GALL_421040 [mine drainage metagenome]|uniref:Uncharacterized protein n=1 Tax=mine drainage metagenome TaxID=410659 RepID=A0A1J5PZ40_9ZZZZ